MLRKAAVLVWLLTGVPTALQGRQDPDAFVLWLSGYLAFGVALAWTSAHWDVPGRLRVAGLLAQSALVVAMTAVQCRGYEGTLLVLVAMQLGLLLPRGTALTWALLQTLALAWAIQHHWSLRPALLLAPPYLGFQVLAVVVMEMLRGKTRAVEELAQANADLLATRELLAESARLNERLRIARDLHDAMGHHLAALSLNLEALAPDAGPAPAALETARTLARRLLDDVEGVVDTLHREGGLDLGRSLAALSAAIPRPVVHLDAAGVVLHDMGRAQGLLRCCQEIITNAVKHSGARNLWISIRVADGAVELEARDDGAGAARLSGGSGLQGMRQRLEDMGGVLDIRTAPGSGFQLKATLPAMPSA